MRAMVGNTYFTTMRSIWRGSARNGNTIKKLGEISKKVYLIEVEKMT